MRKNYYWFIYHKIIEPFVLFNALKVMSYHNEKWRPVLSTATTCAFEISKYEMGVNNYWYQREDNN